MMEWGPDDYHPRRKAMKIVVINASPRGMQGNTGRLTMRHEN